MGASARTGRREKGGVGSKNNKIFGAYGRDTLNDNEELLLPSTTNLNLALVKTFLSIPEGGVRGSTIGEGGDTTFSSQGRSPKPPLQGIGLHDPLHGRQACPKLISFDQGVWSNMSPVEAIFMPFLPKTGTNLLPPPPIVERLAYPTRPTCEATNALVTS